MKLKIIAICLMFSGCQEEPLPSLTYFVSIFMVVYLSKIFMYSSPRWLRQMSAKHSCGGSIPLNRVNKKKNE